MAYDFQNLIRAAKRQDSVFYSNDFATVIAGYKPGHVPPEKSDRIGRLAQDLRSAASFYWEVEEWQEKRRNKYKRRGRPRNDLDEAFIYVMADAWARYWGRDDIIRWRCYDPIKHKERPTLFQKICNLWLREVDPFRDGELKASAFKKAKKRWEDKRQ